MLNLPHLVSLVPFLGVNISFQFDVVGGMWNWIVAVPVHVCMANRTLIIVLLRNIVQMNTKSCGTLIII